MLYEKREKIMRIVARQKNRYLLFLKILDKNSIGRIIDIENKIIDEIKNLQSILLRGYWEKYDLNEEETKIFLQKNDINILKIEEGEK